MGTKLGFLAGGMLMGMVLLVACEPLYESLNMAKNNMMKKPSNRCDHQKMNDIKEMIDTKKDQAIDSIGDKLDDLINLISSIDIEKLKGQSKAVVETVKQKILALKQE